MAKPVIDWLDDTSHVLISPHFNEVTKSLLEDAVEPHRGLQGHLWLSSSGTEHFPKMIALSKKAFLASAKAVNTHFGITADHSWLNVLPLFHAGGLSIHARAHLSDSLVYDFSEEKWNPHLYVERLNKLNISFSSLTPTHVYDLIQHGLTPPKSLQAIIVGGGALPVDHHAQALALGWPLHRSYGMTEMCSQIATAPHPTKKAAPLNHVEIRFDADDFIELKSDALFTGFVHGDDPQHDFKDPKVQGWYKTQDKGTLIDGTLHVYGRGSHFIKIGGESINLSELEMNWESVLNKHRCSKDAVLIDVPDERLGRKICLAVADSLKDRDFTPLLEDFHQQILPIAKIRDIYPVNHIPRSALFKVQREELRNLIAEAR